jgi:alpha-amylase
MCGVGAQAGQSSTCGSYFNPNNRDFPGVPYSGFDFNDGKCRTASGGIENYQDAAQVRKTIRIKNEIRDFLCTWTFWNTI